MVEPQQMENMGDDEVKEHDKSSPQDDIHEQEQSGVGEEAVGSPCPAPQSDPEPKTSITNRQDDEHKAFKDAINGGEWRKLPKILAKHPDFAFASIGLVQDPPLLYIIRNDRAKVDRVRLLMVRQLVEHEGGPANTPVTGETPCTTDIIQQARKTARTTEIVQRIGNTGRPALHSACQKGLRDIAEYLLKTGADKDAVDKDGDTALLVAVANSDDSVVDLLLSHRANPNAAAGAGSSSKGRTALHKAASRTRPSIVDMILRAEPFVDPLDYYGETPLHDAARSGHEHAARMLLTEGAEVDKRSRKQWTPLHQAASHGHEGTVKVLLSFGASTASRTKDGETPESLASKNSHNDVVNLLHKVELLGQSYFGRNPEISKPRESQKRLCDKFTGMVWPKIGESHKMSVMEMLYGNEPLLKQLKNRRQASWIHLPANNKVWVEDVFKLVYHTSETTTAASLEKDDKDKDKATLQGVKSLNVVSNTLQFIEAQYNETSQITHSREPHFRSAQGLKPRARENDMISMVLPVIDTDMQQPRFYEPGRDKRLRAITGDTENAKASPLHKSTRPCRWESTMKQEPKLRRVKEYTISEGRPLNDSEMSHVEDMEVLEREYPSSHFACTLDESFHEILDQKDLNHRNGDQVISRYLARFRVNWEDENDVQDPLAVKNISTDQVARQRDLRRDRVEEGRNDMTGGNSLRDQRQEEVVGHEHSSSAFSDKANKGKHIARTPSQLENQEQLNMTAGESSMWRQPIRNLFIGPTETTDSSESLGADTAAGCDPGEGKENDEEDEEDDDTVSKKDVDNEDSKEEHDGQDTIPRQQLLVVPQLWLWKVENIIVTCFPDRWDSSNLRTLPQIIFETLEKHASIKQYVNNESLDMKVHELLSHIIQTSLEFEPLFSVPNNQRSHHQAFAGEIAFVSGEVARSYDRYRESLGRTADSFAQGVQQETDHLVMVDDILSELAMIRRVEQDQDLVSVAIMGYLMNRYERQRPKKRSAATAGVGGDESLLLTHDTLYHAIKKNRNRAAKLDRQMEDALRVRHSIITLLDLRQRQASTENALESGRQSQILFAQSKVLFIFTVATVIFAPLSWISSLMALQIDNFTPDSWGQAETFAASFVSIVVTFVLCLLGWQLYDRYGARDGATPESKRAGEQNNTRPSIAEDGGLIERLTDQGRHFLETWPRKRQQQTMK